MEQGEDTFVVGAIGWLAQTILASLFAGKLEAWIRELGLADDIDKLKSEIERVEMVAAAVKGRATGNRPLARSLARLKELLYDADDAIDELDYYRLRQQVEGGTCGDPDRTDGHGGEQVDDRWRGDADIPSSSGAKKRSPAWEHFKVTKHNEKGKPAEAEHCQIVLQCGSKDGTSVLHNHLKACKKYNTSDAQANTSSTADDTANGTPPTVGDSGSRKRMRTLEESAHNSAGNTHPWNKGEFSNRIQQLVGQLRGAVSEVLKLDGSDSVASSNHYQSTGSEVCPRTSSVNQRKIYGRAAEKDSIMKMIAGDKHDGVTVLPIVGIGGVGKTALAQLVYNDSTVKSQFDRIWVWVSENFDEVRLTRELLDFVYQERHEGSPEETGRHEGVSSFAKLQEILKGHMEFQSRRFLLILDDIWENMDDYQWDKLLAPLKSSHVKGNVILVTTRQLSIAQRIGTVGPVKLGALANEDFWLLFKACAFGDEDYDAHGSLSTIGRQIADKLRGNPLAAETAGALLREQLTIDHWSSILKNEDWKSLQLSRGIMPALKLSYDKLSYHLQQCFSYCSIFPNNYSFRSEELIYIWIAQGFVNGGHSTKRLEEIGRDYLFDLVNSGFFQQAERDVFSPGKHTCYVMCGLMHDFAILVSRAECATVDGLQYCNEMLPTVHHLSILTDSASSKARHGNILCNDKHEKKLLSAVTSVRKLRSLVLIGQCDNYFLQLLQNLLKEAQNLRVLQISTTYAGSISFMCNVANPTHLRYLKLKAGEEDGAWAQVLSKFCHLQVLDVGSDTDLAIYIGVNNLVGLRHLVAEEDPSIANIGKMTSLQELHNFRVQLSSGFEITQLQSMNELVQLGVSQLANVKTREEAYGAGLTNKQHLEQLHLSWNDTLSQDSYDSDSYESSTDIETEEESSPIDDNGRSSEPYTDTAKEVLEGLEPHHNLRHLRISGYDGATPPRWLATSLISLQRLHLEYCGTLQTLPSMEQLPFLRKLELRNMLNITKIPIPSLEELVLDEMPKLESCSSTSVRDLNSCLRVLKIKRCPVLKIFPLFESSRKFEIEQKSWLSSLGELIIHRCPELVVPHPLPPSTGVSKLSIWRVSTLPTMKGSSSETLNIGVTEYDDEFLAEVIDESSDELRTLDGKMLSFHNLRFLTKLVLCGCRNLTSISLGGFRQLISLKIFKIHCCEKLFSSHDLPEDTHEDMAAADCNALPSLERLRIDSCGITGKWLSLMLRHVQALHELHLTDCQQITTWSAPEASPSGCLDDTLSSSAPEGILRIPLNLIPSLKRICIGACPDLTFCGSKDGFAGFTSLEELKFWRCPELLSSLVHKDGNELCPRLETLQIDDPSVLTTSFCKHLTSLQRLELTGLDGNNLMRLTDEQERALQRLTTLHDLQFRSFRNLVHLPVCLHSLASLKRLEICYCSRISGLPEKGLPPSLEELVVSDCCVELTEQCKKLATSKLKVKTNGEYVN